MKEHADPSLGLLAARSLIERLDAVYARIDGVRLAEDVEEVHQMRVATRRLRAALQLFAPAFARPRLKAWRKTVRRVTRGLGPARDADVQIEFVREFLAKLERREAETGVRRLELRLQQRRRRLQPAVVAAMDALESSHLLEDMSQVMRQMLTRARLDHVDERSPAVFRHARGSIRGRIEELLSYEPFVANPDRVHELHQMRIAAKRLRYSVEVFAPLYDGELKKPLRSIKRVQSLLGDIHDCDVWLDELPEFLEAERSRIVEFYGKPRGFARVRSGIRHLETDRRTHRAELHGRFLELWRSLEADRVWERLLDALDAPLREGEPPAVPRVAERPDSAAS